MSRTWLAKLGYLLARGAFARLREKMDPRKANGGVFLGLNGIVIKSHGGTDAGRLRRAVDLGYDMVRYDLLAKIEQTLGNRARDERRVRERGLVTSCVRSCSAAAAICRSACSPTPSSPARSIPPTNGSRSAPASASATSRRRAR